MDPSSLDQPLSTDRLELEPLGEAHAEPLFGPLQHPDLYTWISGRPPADLDGLRRRWAHLAATRRSPSGDEAWLAWAVRLRDGPYVGKLDASVDGAQVAINVGYLLFPDAWGRGYATEAVGALTRFLLAEGVGPLFATVTRGNVASSRVLEKCGYEFTRILPDNDVIRGVPHDDLEYVHPRR
ncbi:MAG: GNAT family N-acetyltransferase [Myxococcota bacterium]